MSNVPSIFIVNRETEEIDYINHICTNISIASRFNESCSTLTLDILDIPYINFRLGDEIRVDMGDDMFFLGRLFTVDRNDNPYLRSYTFHDYSRYLANVVNYQMPYHCKLSDAFRTLCARMDVPIGRIDDSLYKCAPNSFKNTTINEILTTLADETLTNAHRQFVWRNRNGRMELVDVEAEDPSDILTNILPNVIKISTSESIDSNTFTDIEVVIKAPEGARRGSTKSGSSSNLTKEEIERAKLKKLGFTDAMIDAGSTAQNTSVNSNKLKKTVVDEQICSSMPAPEKNFTESKLVSPLSVKATKRKSSVVDKIVDDVFTQNPNATIDGLNKILKTLGFEDVSPKMAKVFKIKVRDKWWRDKAASTGGGTSSPSNNLVGKTIVTIDLEKRLEYGILKRIIESEQEISTDTIDKLLKTLRNPTRNTSFTILAGEDLYIPGMRIQMGKSGAESQYLVESVTTNISNNGVTQDIVTCQWQSEFIKDEYDWRKDLKVRSKFFTDFYSEDMESWRLLVGSSLDAFGAATAPDAYTLSASDWEVSNDPFKKLKGMESLQESRLSNGVASIKGL